MPTGANGGQHCDTRLTCKGDALSTMRQGGYLSPSSLALPCACLPWLVRHGHSPVSCLVRVHGQRAGGHGGRRTGLSPARRQRSAIFLAALTQEECEKRRAGP